MNKLYYFPKLEIISDIMNNKSNNTMVIRITLDTYHKLDRLRLEKRQKNLQELGQVGDADFDGIINDLLENYQSKNKIEGDEESKKQ